MIAFKDDQLRHQNSPNPSFKRRMLL